MERQAVQAAADLGRTFVRNKVASNGPGTLYEELDRVVVRQRVDRVFALGLNPKRRAARCENLGRLSRSKKRCDLGCGAEEMLEVVEEQERRAVSELFEFAYTCDPRHCGPNQVRLGERRQRHEEHAARELVQELRPYL